jgi:hypothetical protein
MAGCASLCADEQIHCTGSACGIGSILRGLTVKPHVREIEGEAQ